MNGFKWAAFLFYAGILAWEDWRRRELSLPNILAGGMAGALFLAYALMVGSLSPLDAVLSHGSALLCGAGLLFISKITRGAVGKGDGLCFLSFAFWWDTGQLMGLLFLSLLLCAGAGILLMIAGKKKGKESLPYMPFVATAALLLGILSLFPAA